MEPVVAPEPGSTPTKVPRMEERSTGGRMRLKSWPVSMEPRMDSFTA